MFYNISIDKLSHARTFLQQFYPNKTLPINPSDSKLTQHLIHVYNSYHSLIRRSNEIFNHIEEDLIVPVDSYYSYSDGIYRLNNEKMKYIFERQLHYKSLLEKSQMNYLKKTCIANQYNSIHMSVKDIFSGQTSFSLQETDNYHKARALAYNYEQIYRYELERYNLKVDELNKEYNDVCVSLQKHEQDRVCFIKSIIDKFKNVYLEYKIIIDEFTLFINNNISSEVCEKEIKDINNNLLCKHEQGRFVKEQFISFDTFYNSFKGDYKSLVDFSCFNLTIKDPLQKQNKQNIKHDEDHIKNAVHSLLSDNEISIDHLSDTFEILNKNVSFMKLFLDTLTAQKKGFSIKFQNLQNLKHLSTILSFISLQHITFTEESKFELNFKIIYLSERILFQNPSIHNNQKTYLSALLSKNKVYSTKVFWIDIMELRLAHKLEDHITRLKKVNLPDEKKSKGLFSKIGRTLGIANETQKKSLIYNIRLRHLIKNYSQLDQSKIEILDALASTEMCNVIKESIPNFASFNFPSEESLDVVANIAQKYKLPKEHINYFISYITVSTNTIRHVLPSENVETNIGTRANRYKVTKKGDELYKVFSNTLRYLEYKDYMNLLLLNKDISNRLSRKIYKIILRNPKVNNNTRLCIWKCILKVKELKTKYSYQQLLQSVEGNTKLHNEVKMDVMRTFVGKYDENEVDDIKNKILNILKVIAISNGGANYCQGMNFICEFIYELTNDEEEAYYLFLGFFINTEYPLIFAKDLRRLKIFFHVFKRLISLLEPEMFSYFNAHSFDIQCSLPPWFITLFVTARQFMQQKELPIVLIRILDSFIVSGWKAMMKVGMKVLNAYEGYIMNLKLDEMMDFLVNDVLRSDFFGDDNINEIEKCFENTAIKNKLIKNIENEFIQEEKIISN